MYVAVQLENNGFYTENTKLKDAENLTQATPFILHKVTSSIVNTNNYYSRFKLMHFQKNHIPSLAVPIFLHYKLTSTARVHKTPPFLLKCILF